MPYHTTDEINTTNEDCLTTKDTPPPIFFPSSVELVPESATGKEIEFSQQQFNTNSTVIQHSENVGSDKNSQTAYETKNTEPQQFIQQTTKDEGERGEIEQDQFDNVLQNKQIANSSITQKDTICQTNFIDPASIQEAFQQKYQPVEVLNSEEEWISGYFVHKCLVVANLAGVERKYALYDESGSLYAFWGQIRLPRVK